MNSIQFVLTHAFHSSHEVCRGPIIYVLLQQVNYFNFHTYFSAVKVTLIQDVLMGSDELTHHKTYSLLLCRKTDAAIISLGIHKSFSLEGYGSGHP
jgi:hypothetical protein